MQMNRLLCLFATGIMALSTGDIGRRSSSLRVMSYNVRFDSMPDNITVQETIDSLPDGLPQAPSRYYRSTSEKPWSTRRIHVANDILFRQIDIFGGQELLKRQVLDLEELLEGRFAWVGLGRDDGLEKGEFSPIFYNKRRFQLQDWDTFWLSDTPFDVSKYPDAGSYRVATTAHFQEDNEIITVINTHLDDQSIKQRRLGASLILHRAKYEAIKTKRPVIVTGDFNSPKSDGAYQIVTGSVNPEPLNKTFTERYNWTAEEEFELNNFVLKDLLGETPAYRRSGHYATFTDFASVDDVDSFQRLDYIFGGSNGGWQAESYHVGENLRDDGVYSSDHRPVEAQLSVYEDSKLTQQ